MEGAPMTNRTIRILAAACVGVAALFIAAAWMATTPARAAAGTDESWLYSDKENIAEAQGILEHIGLLTSGSYQRGSLDASTGDALTAFQRSHGLPQSGQVDWETLNQLLPHRPGKDSDGDGVPDSRDKCPGTPAGAKVDSKGCPIDGDGDGVPDGLDKCPNTPKGEKVDHDGCSKDSDGDGVMDGTDKCPDTPRGAKVDASGCPVDSDGDGVPDGIDKCPGTPHGTKVNPDGCPVVTDSDGDGVNDDRDKCPDTPRGTKVDANGCPEAAPVFAPGKTSLVLEGVTFDTNSAHLTSSSNATLDRVAEALKANPDVRVEVGGHTDNTGSKATNNKLSAERAKAVKDYLVSKGVSASRLESKGYGSSSPIADNKTADGRAKNRRVELKKIG
jgi:outer membrane protein OmpA-like peptidoglycan-associated protein